MVEIKREIEILEKKKENESFGSWLFHKLFHTDIFVKVRVSEITKQDSWPGRKPPKPLSFQDALKLNERVIQSNQSNQFNQSNQSNQSNPINSIKSIQSNPINPIKSINSFQKVNNLIDKKLKKSRK